MKELRKECEVWKYWIIIILNKKKGNHNQVDFGVFFGL